MGRERPPNRYRELHHAVDTLGNQASGLGLVSEAARLWSVAQDIKDKGSWVFDKDTREWVPTWEA